MTSPRKSWKEVGTPTTGKTDQPKVWVSVQGRLTYRRVGVVVLVFIVNNLFYMSYRRYTIYECEQYVVRSYPTPTHPVSRTLFRRHPLGSNLFRLRENRPFWSSEVWVRIPLTGLRCVRYRVFPTPTIVDWNPWDPLTVPLSPEGPQTV